MKKLFFFFLILTIPALCFGQGDTVATLQPSDLISAAAIASLLAAANTFLTYFSRVLPVLGKVSDIQVRAFVLALILVTGAIYFKGGFFTSETLGFVWNAVLTVVAAFGISGSSGWLYDILRKLLGPGFKSIQ